MFDHICHKMSNGAAGVSQTELLTFMVSQGYEKERGNQEGPNMFKDQDLKQMIEVMIFDQKIEKVGNLYKAVNYQFPMNLHCF